MLGSGLSIFIQKLSCSVMWAFFLEGRAYYYRIYYLFINCIIGYCSKSVNTTTTNSTRIGPQHDRHAKQLNLLYYWKDFSVCDLG